MRRVALHSLSIVLLLACIRTPAAAQEIPEAAAPDAPAPPPPVASVLIAVNADDAEVRVDGEPVGRSPLAPLQLSLGRHVVSVSRPGFRPGSRSIELDADGARLDFALEFDPEQAAQLEPEPEAEDAVSGGPDWYRRWYVWAGAGGALLLGAVIIGVAASSGGGPAGYPLPPIQP
ncbi:MAG: PEGA domain-containing protein [Deltaproteobacteria bacterium]|nr:PEGA domain-containing protein [Deltaproteobacteria bacterium]